MERADGNVDKETNLSKSVDPFGTRTASGLYTADKEKKSQAYCHFFLLNIAVEIWAVIQQNSFSFSAFERCLESAWVLSLSKMNDFSLLKIHCLQARDSA